MPISRKAFNKGKFNSKATVDVKDHDILKFLVKNSKNAYTVKEISKATGLTGSGVRHMIAILKKKGYIAHKSPYFIATLNNKKKK